MQEVPGWLRLLLVGGAFAALLWWERRPLRRPVESKGVRTGRDLAVAGLSAAAIQLAERPVTAPLTGRAPPLGAAQAGRAAGAPRGRIRGQREVSLKS